MIEVGKLKPSLAQPMTSDSLSASTQALSGEYVI